MTDADVEVRVRRALVSWAAEVQPTPPRPGAVRHRVAVRRRRRLVRVAGVVAVGTGVAVLGQGLLSSKRETVTSVADAPSVTTGAPDGPDVATLGDPALPVLDVPGWTPDYVTMGLDLDGEDPAYQTSIRFANGTQSLEVTTYAQGSRPPDELTSPTSVRGVEGWLFDNGATQIQFGWDEADRTLGVNATGFDDSADVLALVEQVRFVDDAEFVAALPPGIGDDLLNGIRSFPDDAAGYLIWNVGGDVECNVEGGGPGC